MAATISGFQDERWHDLIVILDDATGEIYYAQLAQEETTAAVMAGLRAVIEQKGLSLCTVFRPWSPFLVDPGRAEARSIISVPRRWAALP